MVLIDRGIVSSVPPSDTFDYANNGQYFQNNLYEKVLVAQRSGALGVLIADDGIYDYLTLRKTVNFDFFHAPEYNRDMWRTV